MSTDENKIEEIGRVNFKKGDSLIVKCKYPLSKHMEQVFKHEFEEFIKELDLSFDVPVLIIDEGIKLEILKGGRR